MKQNIKPVTPRCGICKKLYSSKNDDGSGLCPKCRPANSQPLLAVKRQIKQTIVMEVGKMMDDFDQEELQEQETVKLEAEETKDQDESLNPNDNNINHDTQEGKKGEFKIENIIEPGRYGVSNGQMIPAMKKAIAEQSLEKLSLLKTTYLYTFEKSIRYLKKAEREFIAKSDI